MFGGAKNDEEREQQRVVLDKQLGGGATDDQGEILSVAMHILFISPNDLLLDVLLGDMEKKVMSAAKSSDTHGELVEMAESTISHVCNTNIVYWSLLFIINAFCV